MRWSLGACRAMLYEEASGLEGRVRGFAVRWSWVWLLILGACGSSENPRGGTQIGFEESLGPCVLLAEAAVGPDAVPPGFAASPQQAIAVLVGDFHGPQLDDQEMPTDLMVDLTVADPGGTVTLQTYEPGPGADPLTECPPDYEVSLDFVVVSDGLPTFVQPVLTRVSTGGEASAVHEGAAGFDGALPAPTTLDPSDAKLVGPRVDLAGGGSGWWVYVSWHGLRDDGGGEDGAPTELEELVMMADLDPA